MTKKKFAQNWLDVIQAEIYKREFIIEVQSKKEKTEVDIDALTTNNAKDKEMAVHLEEWIKNN